VSYVVGVHECDCSCHREPGVLHNYPCCAGRCAVCRRFIHRGSMEEHLATHKAAIEQATKNAEEIKRLSGGD